MPRHEELHTYDDVGREVVVERPVPRRRVRFATSPSQIVSAAVGGVLVAFGVFAVARAGLDGPHDEPQVEVLGLGEATTEKLISAGIETVQELAAAPLEKLVEIPGIGEKTAEKVLATAQEYLAAQPVAEAAPAELEFTPEMSSGEGPEADAAAPQAAEGEPHAG